MRRPPPCTAVHGCQGEDRTRSTAGGRVSVAFRAPAFVLLLRLLLLLLLLLHLAPLRAGAVGPPAAPGRTGGASVAGAARSTRTAGAAVGAGAAAAARTVAAAKAGAPTRLPVDQQPQDPSREAQWLQVQNAALRARVELADKEEFYLLLDLSGSNLKLMLKGAVLQNFAVQSVEVGTPRVVFVRKVRLRDWAGRVWSAGQLEPVRERERVEIIAPPPSAAEEDSSAAPAVPIPPTPEEAYKVPPLYHVRFADGLSLEIRHHTPQGAPQAKASQGEPSALASWWRDARSVLRARTRDRVRLLLVLSSGDAASLYRSLPPDIKLLILPPP
jgi:hypothetical protein